MEHSTPLLESASWGLGFAERGRIKYCVTEMERGYVQW